jgi:hypothetical protein
VTKYLKEINLKKKRFGSQFQRFWFMVGWPGCSKVVHHGRSMWGRKAAHFMAAGKQRERAW